MLNTLSQSDLQKNKPNGGSLFKKIMLDYSYWVSFFVLLIVARISNASFFSWNNIITLFRQGAIIGVIALGMSLVVFAGEIDISVGAQAAIISSLGISVLNQTGNIFLMFLFCCIFGLFLGTINGALVTFGGMPAMVATLAMQSACRSLVEYLGKDGPFGVDKSRDGLYETFRMIAAGNLEIGPIKVPYMMIIFILMTVLFYLITTRTRLGKHVYAVGSNAKAARLSGINVHFIKLAVFAITGLMCGVGGFLLASRLTTIQPSNAGLGFEMEAIASVAIGGASMSGGRGKIIGTFLGVLMFRMINNILVSANVPALLNGLVSGCIIVIAVLMQNFQNKHK